MTTPAPPQGHDAEKFFRENLKLYHYRFFYCTPGCAHDTMIFALPRHSFGDWATPNE
jgi:hypothetical protein